MGDKLENIDILTGLLLIKKQCPTIEKKTMNFDKKLFVVDNKNYTLVNCGDSVMLTFDFVNYFLGNYSTTRHNNSINIALKSTCCSKGLNCMENNLLLKISALNLQTLSHFSMLLNNNSEKNDTYDNASVSSISGIVKPAKIDAINDICNSVVINVDLNTETNPRKIYYEADINLHSKITIESFNEQIKSLKDGLELNFLKNLTI